MIMRLEVFREPVHAPLLSLTVTVIRVVFRGDTPETQLPVGRLQSVCKMQQLILACLGLLALVSANECPGGGRCGVGQTCCGPTGVSGEQLCCPAGQRCSADGRSCIREGVVWCDSTTHCPDGYTCCKLTTDDWNCCPLPQAVCCSDNVHCCPHGTTCNLPAQTCDNTTASVPQFRKVPMFPWQGPRLGDVVCDATHRCPAMKTCCRNKVGDWSCCPLPQAVCCDDHEHCCPTDTTCDLATLTCVHHSGSTPMLRKDPAVMVMAVRYRVEMEEEEEREGLGAVIPCDDHTSCEDSHTCCFMKSLKKWGCCPLPKAVCCADGEHCCPTGYKCSEHHNSCTRGDMVLPWYTKIPAIRSDREDHVESALLMSPQLRDVPCDEKTSCRDGQTCCRTSATTWGCCPMPNAVCCSDMQRCCPAGTTCTATGDCTKEPRLYWHN